MKISLASLLVATSALAQVVPWTAETSSVLSSRAGDPTFVVVPRPADAGVRLVVGTDTGQPGIFTWAPDGVLEQILTPFGLVNAADSRGPLVVVTSANNTLLLFEVSDAGLTQLEPANFNVPSPGQVAFAQNADGGFEVWVDTSSPTVEHFAMSPVVDGGVTFTALASLTVPERPSGLAVDDRTGRLYVAQPTMGVIAVERDGGAGFLISIDAGHLGPLVGGIDLFLSADGGALLFSASPTPEEVVVHSISGGQATFRTALQIGAPDGGGARAAFPHYLDVYERPLPGFPRGVLVVQDGTSGNYKIVSLADVNAVFPLPDPYIPGGATDAGVVPVPDAGPDAGTDAGVDAGVVDGGAGDAGSGGGRPPGPAPGVAPTPTCGCTGGPFAVLPALLLLWWIRRIRS